jgi:cholesterol transport system auxiliary component
MIRAMLATLLLGLTGCVSSRPALRQFDLGDFDALKDPPSTLATNLVVADVGQPSWMRTRDMFYRLDYEPLPRPQRYTINQWVATPGELVTLRLRQTVQGANAGFTLTTASVSSDYLLQSTLEEFTQAFTSPAGSQCIVQLSASLWNKDGHIVGQRVFRADIPAPTPNASGGAACLTSAVNRISDEIVQWLGTATATASNAAPNR